MMRRVKFIEINQLKIAYQVEGIGSPVILLHGWGCEANIFKFVFESLSNSHQVYVLDLPGFGLSENPPTAWDACDYAKLLSLFLDKLNINRAHLIGHSYGGRISIVLAAEEAEKVNKLILVDSAGIIPRRYAKYYIRVCISKIGRLLRHCGTFGNRIADRVVHRVGSKDYQEAGAMRATLVKSVNQNLIPLLPKIQAPTLLIWGENDTDTPVSDGKIMESEIPQAELVVLKNAGHYSFLDQSDQFCQIVSNFLE